MGTCASTQGTQYLEQGELPKEYTAPAHVHFYGKGKPLDKDGKDHGLKEVWSCWSFPRSTDKSIVILPKWKDSVHGEWSTNEFDDFYDMRLGKYGLSKEDLVKILEKLNTLLVAFWPFQRDRKSAIKKRKGKQVDTGTETFYYALQMRKILAQAGMDFPQTTWSLHIHKHMQVGSGDGMFTEVVYHSLSIELCEQMPEWWQKEQQALGTGSAWHVWESPKVTPEADDAAGSTTITKDKPVAEQTGKAPKGSTLDKLQDTSAEADVKQRQAKRKGSQGSTFSSLESFAEQNQN